MARGIRQAVESKRVALSAGPGRPVSTDRQGAILAHIIASRGMDEDPAMCSVLGDILANGMSRRELTAIAWLEYTDLGEACQSYAKDSDELSARSLRARILETLRKLAEPEDDGEKIPASINIQVNVGDATMPGPQGDPIQVG